jgi:hypothetical protein
LWGLAEVSSAMQLRWAAVNNLDDWGILPVEAISPARLWHSQGSKLPAALPGTLLRQAEKRPISILEYGARRGFFRMRAEIIDKLARDELGMAFDAGTSWPRRLLAVVKQVLGCTDEEALKAVEARTFHSDLVSGIDDVLMSDEVQSSLTQCAMKETSDLLEQLHNKKKEEDSFKEFLASLRQSTHKRRRAVKFVGDGERALTPASFS